jgi:hypothetical protein
MTVWTALDDCPPNSGVLQVIRGSHKVGEVPFGPTSAEEPTLTPEQLMEYAPEERRVELLMGAGEVIPPHITPRLSLSAKQPCAYITAGEASLINHPAGRRAA